MISEESNVKQHKSEATTKIIYNKLDLSWYLAGTYLDIMRGLGAFSCDKEFNRLFGELRDYVDKKFFSQCDGDINDIFVVAEQIIKNKFN